MKGEQNWFEGRFPRELSPIPYGDDVSPLLFSNAKDIAHCYLSLRILDELFDKGGTSANSHDLLLRVEGALPATTLSILEDELEKMSDWIARVDLPYEESNADLRFVRGQDKGAFRAIVIEAIEQEIDLRCEYYRQHDQSWCLDRGTPISIDEAFFVLESTAGVRMDITFEDLRWIMLTSKTRSSPRARILSFPGHLQILDGEE